MRCLKRRLASHIWRLMIRDEQSRNATIDIAEIAA